MTARGRPSTPGQSAADLHHLALGSGVEFDLIRTFLREWSDAARGVGGDCAVLEVPAGAKLVVSTDTSVEHVHFRSDWLTPAEIGYRAAAAALSDLAAAAATPVAVLLALSAPPEWLDRLPDVARGIGQAVRDADASVVGGDTTAGPALSLTLTVLGTADRPLTRDAAQVGDRVYVTGTFGGPAAAVSAWTRGETPTPEARARFAHRRLGGARHAGSPRAERPQRSMCRMDWSLTWATSPRRATCTSPWTSTDCPGGRG